MATPDSIIASAGRVAEKVLALGARRNDREGRFSPEAVAALGEPVFSA